MHFNFSTDEVLWTLTFAGLLVLLVVLLGRDRARRFPWFTTSMVLLAVSMLARQLLPHRLAQSFSGMTLQIKAAEIFLPLADVSAIVSLLVAVEIARRAFRGVKRKIWIPVTIGSLAVGGVVLKFWGAWPSLKTMFAGSLISNLQLLDLFAKKTDLLAQVLVVLAGLLVVIFGHYYKAGWHSHTQQLAIGLTMSSVALLTIRGAVQHVQMTAVIHSQEDVERVQGLLRSFQTADGIIFLVVLLWWIACLWFDEPGTEDRDRGTESGDQEPMAMA
ncbi:MAG: hypothetical protein ACRD3S_15820 [Terracidiphilus sp.]